MKKRILSLLLVVIMVAAMIPVVALPSVAASDTGTAANTVSYAHSLVTLDGANTDGEYDNAEYIYADKVTHNNRNHVISETKYRVVYTEDAIYVLMEMADDTSFAYNDGENGNIAMWGQTEYTDLYYSIGSSFVGYGRFYRDSYSLANTADHAQNFGGSAVMNENTCFKTINNVADGYTVEVKFPVASMSAEDQAAFRAGTLELAFNVLTKDNKWEAWGTDTNYMCYSDNARAAAFAAGGAELVSEYTPFAMEARTIAYDYAAPTFDGKNTAGEYDDALVVPMGYTGSGWWAKTPDANDVAYVKFTNEAIYVYVKGDNGTTNETYDMTGIGFRVGTSFVGTKIVQNNYFASTLVSLGEVTVENNNTFFSYYYNMEEGALDLEVKFPVALMTEADQEAFRNGTLEIALGFMNMDNYTATASFPIGSYNAFLSKEDAEKYVLPYLASFKLQSRIIDAGEEAVAVTDKLALNYTINWFDPVYEGAQMKFTIGDAVIAYVNGTLVDPVTKEYSYSYAVSYQYMGERITVELVNNGIVLETIDSYIMKDYCLELLDKTIEELGITSNEYEYMKKIIYAALELGAASQDATDYKTDDLVNDQTAGMAPDYDVVYKDIVVENGNNTCGIEILGTGVYFDGEQMNKMYVEFKAAGIDVSKLKVNLTTTSALRVAKLTIVPVEGKADTYMVITPVVDSANFHREYKINIAYYPEASVQFHAYSITCNVNAGLAALMESDDAAIANLAYATYQYGVTVRYYKAS